MTAFDDRKAVIVDVATAPLTELRYGRGTVRHLVNPDVGARNVDLHLNTIRPGTPRGPYHRHDIAENVYYVLEGEVCIRVEGVDFTIRSGQAMFIPPGVPHSAHNEGTGEARVLEIYAPAGADFIEVETEDSAADGRSSLQDSERS